jgi:hypothetical protein
MANPTGKGGWQKGQSGNPAGRPPKHRALTEILERAGSSTIEVDGKRVSGKRLVARLLWEVAKTGQCVMPDGRVLKAGPQGWLDVVKFIYSQVDGPPPKDVNIGGQVENPLLIEVLWDESGLYDGEAADATPSASGGEGE